MLDSKPGPAKASSASAAIGDQHGGHTISADVSVKSDVPVSKYIWFFGSNASFLFAESCTQCPIQASQLKSVKNLYQFVGAIVLLKLVFYAIRIAQLLVTVHTKLLIPFHKLVVYGDKLLREVLTAPRALVALWGKTNGIC